MVIVKHPILVAGHVHIQRITKTKPGGEWTWEKRSVFLKCTLSTETVETNWKIFRSELVGYRLPFTFKCTKTTTVQFLLPQLLAKKELLTVVSSSVGFYLNRLQIVRLCFGHMTTYQLEAHEYKVSCLRELIFK